MKKTVTGHSMYITTGSNILKLKVNIPPNPIGVVLICDDQDQPELVSRNDLVGQIFNKECFITVQAVKEPSAACDANVILPAVLDWIANDTKYSYLPVAIFCSGKSASGTFRASVNAHDRISAIAVRSGLLDLNPHELSLINVPVLFITADRDEEMADKLKQEIIPYLTVTNNLKIISNATRYFTELGKLGHVVFLAVEWFRKNMFTKAKTA